MAGGGPAFTSCWGRGLSRALLLGGLTVLLALLSSSRPTLPGVRLAAAAGRAIRPMPLAYGSGRPRTAARLPRRAVPHPPAATLAARDTGDHRLTAAPGPFASACAAVGGALAAVAAAALGTGRWLRRQPGQGRPSLAPLAALSLPGCDMVAALWAMSGTAAPRDAPAALQPYAEWCAAADVRAPVLELRASPAAAGGRGAFAIRPVGAGEVLVDLPLSAVLHVVQGMATPFPDFVSEAGWAVLPFQGQLACRLLYEAQHGAASAFAPYIAQLPEAFDRAPRWASKDLAALHYPHLEQAVRRERAAVQAWQAALRDCGSPCPRGDRFQWAVDVVFSRLFSGELAGATPPAPLALRAALVGGGLFLAGAGDSPGARLGGAALMASALAYDALARRQPGSTCYGLFPMVDAINHRTRAATLIEYDGAARRFALRADGPTAAGEECFVSYGPLDNDELLLRYGFVEAENPSDVYRFDNLLARVPPDMLRTVAPLPATLRMDGTLDDVATAALAKACGGGTARDVLRRSVQAELSYRAALTSAPLSPRAPLIQGFLREKLRVLRRAREALG